MNSLTCLTGPAIRFGPPRTAYVTRRQHEQSGETLLSLNLQLVSIQSFSFS